ncbi:hypothetical protein T484DRAFT_2704417 [Baffinella frigidus]|nr:hypothetical protein T484DRAFT_2704417 [Cryptophyta sp. CCMP2293]
MSCSEINPAPTSRSGALQWGPIAAALTLILESPILQSAEAVSPHPSSLVLAYMLTEQASKIHIIVHILCITSKIHTIVHLLCTAINTAMLQMRR